MDENAVDRIAALNKQLEMAKLVEESNNPSFDPLASHCANDSALLNYLAERYGMDEFKNRVLTREATTTRSTEDDDDDDGDVGSANTQSNRVANIQLHQTVFDTTE
jgi:hypothetical protein